MKVTGGRSCYTKQMSPPRFRRKGSAETERSLSCGLRSRLGGHLALDLEQLLDALVHREHGLDLRDAQAALVGDVVDTALGLGVLAMDATDRELEVLGELLEVGTRAHVRELDVHARAHCRPEVGGTRRHSTVLGMVRERQRRIEDRHHAGETIEDLADVAALLHRDDAELVLLVGPHERRLVGVVEDAASARPVVVGTDDLEEAVTLLEEEVIVHELLADVLVHALERVEIAGEIASELLLERRRGALHDLEALLLGDHRRERVALEVAAHADARRDDGLPRRIDRIGRDLVHVEVRHVVPREPVVVGDERAEERLEHVVRLGVAGVGADSGVEVQRAADDRHAQREVGRGALLEKLVARALIERREVLQHQHLGVEGRGIGHRSGVTVGGVSLRLHE